MRLTTSGYTVSSVFRVCAATLLAFSFLAHLMSRAEATAISIEATFTGEVIGDFNGTDYVGPSGSCPSGINCSHTFLPSTASVTGTVTETTGEVNFSTGPQQATIITQNFQGSGPFGSFSTTSSSATPGSLSTSCQQNLLLCLSVNGFGGSTALGSPITANLGLQPNYAGAPTNATTLPIQYPFNFTVDSLYMNANGGTFESGAIGSLSSSTCTVNFGGSIDSFGRCFVGSVSGSATSALSAQAPTVQTLGTAEVAQYFPNLVPSNGQITQHNPDGTTQTFTAQQPPIDGQDLFHATVYVSDDKTQTIIAMRGGTLGQDAAALYTIAQGVGTFTDNPGTITISQTDQLAKLVKDIANANPATHITLTSFSIGGVPVQVVAQAAGIQGVTFDSQGATNMLPFFAGDPNLIGFNSIASPSQQIINYRLQGDQVSLWTPRIGSQITVADPAGLPPTFTIFGQHDPTTLLSQLLTESPEFPGVLGRIEQTGTAGDISILPDIIFAVTAGNAGGILNVFQDISTFQAQLKFDPQAGWAYSLSGSATSPEFASMQLPLQDNIAAWELIYFTDTGMSATETSDTGIFDFGPGVDRLDFFALDGQGNHIMVDTPFFFGLTFDSVGTFNGSVFVTTAPNSVPEPSTLPLFGAALIGAYFYTARLASISRRDSR